MKFFLLAFISLHVFAQNLKPGLWSANAAFEINGIPMPPSKETECLSKSQTNDAKGTIEKSLKQNNCVLTKWKLNEKKLLASVSCKNKDYDAKGDLHGKFDNKSYNLTGDITGTHFLFGEATATVNLSGQWLKDCRK
ncbi:MAG: DUF3617 family protein [Pseudobdellovibrio sp.]